MSSIFLVSHGFFSHSGMKLFFLSHQGGKGQMKGTASTLSLSNGKATPMYAQLLSNMTLARIKEQVVSLL